MSVYKSARSPYWHFDFQVRGHRFHGTTKCTTRREAEKVEAAERDKAKRLVAQLAAAKTSLKLDDVADRWWSEVGQHHAGANNTEHELALLIEFFGKDKLLPEITGDDVARLGAWRRGHRRKDGALISPHTVNHTMSNCESFSPGRNCGACVSSTSRGGASICLRCQMSACASYPTTKPTGSTL